MIPKHIKKNHSFDRRDLALATRAYRALEKAMEGIQPGFAKKSSVTQIEKAMQYIHTIRFNLLTSIRR